VEGGAVELLEKLSTSYANYKTVKQEIQDCLKSLRKLKPSSQKEKTGTKKASQAKVEAEVSS
jgi:hypothetical protein